MEPKVLYIKRKENETNPLNIPTPCTLIHVTHTRTCTYAHTPLNISHTTPKCMEYGAYSHQINQTHHQPITHSGNTTARWQRKVKHIHL